ncbi:AI-2E family transporter [archaeon]|nr:AI-2E family transporter [archaeon]PJC45208.1 MAG: hypothetical protein CO037_02665 [Candidatus Pacearchaeota archaeon CG_4_9_14_0_2_um_filter_30_8]
MDKKEIQNITSIGIFLVLITLSFFVLKELLISILAGVILGFVFLPLYNFIQKKLKNKTLSAIIVCAIFLGGLIIPIWFLTPVVLNQSISVFISSQNIDFVSPLKSVFPGAFSSPEVTSEIARVMHSFVTNLTSGAMNAISNLLLQFPVIFLNLLVTFFIFFYVLRDNQEFVNYIKSVLPFKKEIETKIFKSSKDITSSIIYGQVIVGILQGLLVGIGFFIFGVPNALFFTILSVIAGIFPVIGATVIWIPLVLYLFLKGEFVSVIGITVFGILGSFFENSVKPIMIYKKTNVHPGIILLGMIGGIYFLGFLGFILGPLILAYLLIIIEIYRDKKVPGIFIQNV